MQRGEGRLTVVEGEPGMGKSRLAASFIDSATSQRRARVLRGRCHENAPLVSYEVFSEALGDLLASDPTLVERTLGDAPEAVRQISPATGTSGPRAAAASPSTPPSSSPAS